MSPKTAKNVSLVLSILGCGFLLFATSGQNTFFTVLGVIGCILVFAGLIIELIYWRCTSCGRHLPRRGSFGFECCPYCGEYLD